MLKMCRRFYWIALMVLVCAHHLFAAPGHAGQVTIDGIPVPGATVTASSGDTKFVTVTDDAGRFAFADVTEGKWTLRVEMLGFETLTREVDVTAEPQTSNWAFTIKSFADITAGLPPRPDGAAQPAQVAGSPLPGPNARTGTATAPTPRAGRGGFQRADVTASPSSSAPSAGAAPNRPAPTPTVDEPSTEAGQSAADGFLINGSVNNGAASPFAQPAAFGNNRRRPGALYNFGFAVVEGNSAFNSSPFTFAGQPTTKPSYNDLHLVGTFGGPLRLWRPLKNPPVLFVAFQSSDDHTATTQPGVMPTSLERAGDFSQSRDPMGRSITVVDPTTGKPFAGDVIPSARISPQAAALLSYYPQPNLSSGGGFNFQAPLITATHQDLLTTRANQALGANNQLIGLFAYQRTTTDQTTIFGFQDASTVSGVDTMVTWTHRVTRLISIRPHYRLTELTTSATPYFANRTNVSGLAGIVGNNQDPANWGPPSLTFSSITGLSDATPNFNRTTTQAGGVDTYWTRGRHNFTIGGDLKRNAVDILSQQNPRGAFAFTGAATGSDFADFLLGIPSTSSIAFGNADKYLRGSSYDAYVTDDWRFSPSLTMQIGARWEYEAPLTELRGRLVNLATTPNFTAASPALGAELQPDRSGIQPRVALAWRPIPGSSLVFRAGYGLYRNTSVYQPIVTLLAQQPPFSKAFTIANSAANPLSLANGFSSPVNSDSNTFAVDPNLRVGESHNWQALVQRDLPGSMTVTMTYLGTRGVHLLQEFLPNTYPSGSVNPCPTCPSGFVYLSSNGSSLRNAGQVQVRRRLRSGLAATVQYTLSKATDNATAFSGVSLTGSAIAQDWRNLDAEQAPSSFDQRHVVTAQVQFTTGMGLGGGALLDGLRGRLYKGWTLTSQLTTGSGLPFTPVYLAPVPGTGVTGSLRPSLTGASLNAPTGYYLNPAAYVAPAPGQWGNAGRNSLTGPAQFALDFGVTRTFQLTPRLSFDWRLDATNVLDRETYTGVNAIFGGPQFGLPNVANSPRKVLSTMRLRF